MVHLTGEAELRGHIEWPHSDGGYPASAQLEGGGMRFLDEGFRLRLVDGDEWMLSAACRTLVECVESGRK